MKSAAAWFFLLPAALMADEKPLLENGGFEGKSLAPWECEEGKVLREEKNAVLEVTLDGGVFSLVQDFRWPEKKEKLTLRFRVKADEATRKSPVQLRLRLLDAEGDSEISATRTVEKSGQWHEVTWTLEQPELEVTSLMIESNRGEGKIWLDDISLK